MRGKFRNHVKPRSDMISTVSFVQVLVDCTVALMSRGSCRKSLPSIICIYPRSKGLGTFDPRGGAICASMCELAESTY